MTLYIMPLFIGTTEIILIAAVGLLLFGGKKFPEMMRGMGKGVQEFKKGMSEPLPEDEQKDQQEESQEEPSREALTTQKEEPADKQ